MPRNRGAFTRWTNEMNGRKLQRQRWSRVITKRERERERERIIINVREDSINVKPPPLLWSTIQTFPSPELTNISLLFLSLSFTKKKKKKKENSHRSPSSNRGKHPSDERVKVESRTLIGWTHRLRDKFGQRGGGGGRVRSSNPPLPSFLVLSLTTTNL